MKLLINVAEISKKKSQIFKGAVVSCIIRVRSLFVQTGLSKSLFYTYFLKKLAFCLLAFSVFPLYFVFFFEVIFME